MELGYDVSRGTSAGSSNLLPPAMVNRRKPLVAKVPDGLGYTPGMSRYKNYETMCYKRLQGW